MSQDAAALAHVLIVRPLDLCSAADLISNMHMWVVQRNFDRPVEWGMIKDYPWSTPQLRKLDVPVRPYSYHLMQVQI